MFKEISVLECSEAAVQRLPGCSPLIMCMLACFILGWEKFQKDM